MIKVNFWPNKKSKAFHIGRRYFSLFKKINSQFVVVAVIFLAGTACLWFAQVVEAGITQWQANSVTAVDNDGNGFSCAIANNKVYCWGSTNTYGQLGTGDNTTTSLIPRQIVDPDGVLVGRQLTQLAISNSGAVCVIASGVVNCWGRGATYYLLGNNSTNNRYYPGPVTITGVVTRIAGGDAHFCAVASGLAYCWGSGGSGRLGDNATTTNKTPGAVTASGVLSGKTVTDIGAGGSHTCAVASGAAYCWGSDTSGELGNNTTLAGSNVPVVVDASGVLSGKTVTAIDADSTHTCAIASGASYCWGLNDVGQLGDTTTTNAPVPVATKADQNFPLDGKTVRSVDAGNKRTCVTDTEENAYCWGRGPLGDGANLNSSYPVRINASPQVLNGMSVGIASAGYTGNCFVNSFSNMYCTSLTANGTLGNNTTNASNPPVLALFSYGIETSAYRLYEDSTTATPGSPLATVNSPATLTSPGQSFRLRTGIQTKYQFTQISVGYGHACGISTDGYAYCWGNNVYGALGNTAGGWQPTLVDRSGVLAGKTIRQISAGAYHTCAIASDSKAYCWGYDGDGGLGNSAYGNSTAPVAVDTSGLLAGKSLVSISAGGFATCVITSDSDTYCWGRNDNGQLGNNNTTSSAVPATVNVTGLSGDKFVSVSSGATHVCALTTKYVAYCWGAGANGRLGNSGTADSLVPVAVTATGVLSGKTVLSIRAGAGATCAVASDTKAYCWGLNSSGQLGDNSTTERTAPVAVNVAGVLSGKKIVSVTTSDIHSCAVDSAGLAYCWGTNTNGQLGNNSTSQSLVPVAVDATGSLSGKTLLMVSSLWHYTCGYSSDGTVHCWGLNSYGNLGDGTNYQSLVPKEVMEQHSIQTFAVGAAGSHTCGITPIGIAKCWGLSTSGQMGNGYATQSPYPMALDYRGVLLNKTIKSIATGGAHTCAIASDDKGYCWGAGTSGQLGNNGSSNSLTPVAVSNTGVLSGKTLISISAGDSYTCAIASDYKAYCWGLGTSGQLGNNGSSNSLVPVAVDVSGVLSGKNLVSISTGGGQHACAVATDGKVYCWGENGNGQLGNNSTTDSQAPVAVTVTGVLSSKTIVSVSAGLAHTCALSADGYTYCWGLNSSGQLGDNSTTQRLVPVEVYTAGNLSGLKQISLSSGANHNCVMASNNNGYCWGSNSTYQLGNNSTTNSSVPVYFSATGLLAGEAIRAVYTTGAENTCALTVTGKGYCWGSNSYGQYGANSYTNPITSPTSPLALTLGEIFGTNIVTGNNTFKLQFAQRTAATCSLQTTGFADVTNSSEIAYSDNPNVANGSTITSNASDPLAQSVVTAQTFVDQQGTFTNATAIEPGKTGLWDFSLKDNAPDKPNTPFCLKVTYGDGTALEYVNSFPEIRTGTATLSLGFVDSSGADISNPDFTMNDGSFNGSGIQTTTGVFADNNKRLRVWNGSQSAIGWTVSMAATNGPTAYWDRTTDSLTSYDFNDGVNGADGGDADSIGGRLTISGTNAVITPVGSCTSTGVSASGGGSFVEGTTNSITLLTGSTSADPGCSWDYTNAELTQIIPAGQPVGEYRIWMTVTIVSQ